MVTQKAKTRKRLPDFEKMSLDEIAEFWETHDSADYWDQLEDVTDQVTFKRPAKKTISVRIAEEDLKELRRIAAEKGLGPTTLIRAWIREKLHGELSLGEKKDRSINYLMVEEILKHPEQEFVERLAKTAGFTKKDARKAIDSMIELINQGLSPRTTQ